MFFRPPAPGDLKRILGVLHRMLHLINRRAVAVGLAGAVTCGVTACGTTAEDSLTLPSAPSVSLPMGTDVVLAPGEYVSVNPGSLRLTFASVLSESRCPLSVQCIQAGSARVALRVTTASGTRDVPLETTRSDTATVDRYFVRLVGVAPVPATPTAIPAAVYRVTLRITVK